ncbi:MAG: cytochrome c biogenesis protein CcdA, partial [Candidatus Methanofastidiosia archaeon]
ISIILFLFPLPASSSPETIEIIFFYEEGCSDCQAFKPHLDVIEQKYGDNIHVTRYDVFTSEGWDIYVSYGFTKVPAIVIGDTKLQIGAEFTKDNIENIIDSYLGEVVKFEYFYEEGCDACDAFKPVLEQLEEKYGENLKITEYDVFTSEGWERFSSYGFFHTPAVAINEESRIEYPETTYEKLDTVIDNYLKGESDGYSNIKKWSIPVAFTLGFFSSFSPCLMAVLSFILAYTAGTSKRKSEAMAKSLLFGLGLVIMYTIIAVAMAIVGKQLTNLKFYMSLFGSVITFILGLNLLNYVFQAVEFPVSTKGFSKRVVRQFVGERGYFGAVVLGIIFSTVKLPCAAPALVVILTQIVEKGDLVYGMALIGAFSVGVLLPFVGIGIISGGTTDVARKLRWSRSVRAIVWGGGGVVVLAVSFWILYTAFNQLPVVTDTYFFVTLATFTVAVMLIIYALIAWRRKGPKEELDSSNYWLDEDAKGK